MPGVLVVSPASPADLGAAGLVEAIVDGLDGWRPAVTSPTRVLRALPRSAGLVVAGGTLFAGEDGGRRLARVARWVAAGRALRRPVVLLGVGAVGLRDRPARRAIRVAEGCDLLVLRDEDSAAALCRCGARPPLRIGADPTWTLLDRRPPPPGDGGDRVVVVPGRSGLLLRRVLSLLAGLDVEAAVLPWGHPLPPAAAPAALPAPAGVLGGRDLLAAAAGIAVTTALHGLVAAASAAVPAVAVGSEPGLEAMASRLSQPWLPATLDEPALAAGLSAARASGPATASAVKSEVARAEEGFRLVRLILNGGTGEEAETLVGLPLGPVTWQQ